jgi:benzylsuccinate CoA-transferase BbsE subunit
MPLSGVRVVDLTDERGIYGAKLLADLGADVIRPEPPSGDPLRRRGPFVDTTTSTAESIKASLWHAFFASNRRFFSVDLATATGREQLGQLLQNADIVLTCQDAFAVREADLQSLQAKRPELVVIDVSSFGNHGPWADYLAPDIVAGALGGFAATTGDVDTPPLKGFGELNFMVSGAYVAIAALAALNKVRKDGQGQRARISVHECIASCIEHVFMFYCYAETLQRPEGRVVPRRGALHWSDAYDVVPAKNGSVMVTPAPDFDTQLMWLIEEGAQEDLIDPKYQEPENLRLRVERSMEVLRNWSAGKDAEELFLQAQERHCPYGWVLPLEAVAENPQLAARNWYRSLEIGDKVITAPGAAFHFSNSQGNVELPLRPHQTAATQAAEILTDLGWSNS